MSEKESGAEGSKCCDVCKCILSPRLGCQELVGLGLWKPEWGLFTQEDKEVTGVQMDTGGPDFHPGFLYLLLCFCSAFWLD